MKDTESFDQKAVGEIIQSILSQQVQCVLATQCQGKLYQHLMAYAMSENLATITLASFRHTQKVNNIGSEPNVGLLWDNRTGNNKDHTDGFALSAQGAARILGLSCPLTQPLLDRNASLQSLLSHDDAVIIAIRIESYHLAIGYAQTFRFSPASA